MVIHTTDWNQLWVTLIAGCIGALLGGSIGAWAKSYFGKKGEHRAYFEDLDNLLATKFAEQTEAERGRFKALEMNLSTVQAEAERKKAGELSAIDQHLQSIEKHTELITSVQATIQGQISERFWKKQNLLNQRRDLFSRILNTTSALIEGYRQEINSLPINTESIQDLRIRMTQEQAEARIFLSTAAIEVLFDFSDGSPSMSPKTSMMAIRSLQEQVIKAARIDLEIDNV